MKQTNWFNKLVLLQLFIQARSSSSKKKVLFTFAIWKKTNPQIELDQKALPIMWDRRNRLLRSTFKLTKSSLSTRGNYFFSSSNTFQTDKGTKYVCSRMTLLCCV